MYLGLEIGGSKLQLGVGTGRDARLTALVREPIQADHGAGAILDAVARAAPPLLAAHAVERIGIGFGGPVDAQRGLTLCSHQVAGWVDFPLAAWCQERLGRPAVVGNDADLATLAEARFGAGRGSDPVFYITVGSGVGGGLVVGGRLYRGHGAAVAEIGHLRPGLDCRGAEQTVEALASGFGLAERARQRVARALAADGATAHAPEATAAAELVALAGGEPAGITGELVGRAAAVGNPLAGEVLAAGVEALGWAIAQVVTLIAPQTIVVGGGVARLGEALFFAPLRAAAARYVFPPLAEGYRIVPAALGEEMVVLGALALAADASDAPPVAPPR